MRRSTKLVLVGVATLAVASGCAPAARSAGPDEIVMEDYRFIPNRIDAKAGQPLTIRLTNRGAQAHDLTFASLHMPGLEGIEAFVDPGGTKTVTLTFPTSGEHTFTCSIASHAAAGMTGAAFVSP